MIGANTNDKEFPQFLKFFWGVPQAFIAPKSRELFLEFFPQKEATCEFGDLARIHEKLVMMAMDALLKHLLHAAFPVGQITKRLRKTRVVYPVAPIAESGDGIELRPTTTRVLFFHDILRTNRLKRSPFLCLAHMTLGV